MFWNALTDELQYLPTEMTYSYYRDDVKQFFGGSLHTL